MKKNTSIEDLFEAARQVEANRQRQQTLSTLIDQWEEEEKALTLGGVSHHREGKEERKRRPIWAWISIAASLLLLASTAQFILRQASGASTPSIIASLPDSPTEPVACDTARQKNSSEEGIPRQKRERKARVINSQEQVAEAVVPDVAVQAAERSSDDSVVKSTTAEEATQQWVEPQLAMEAEPKVYERQSTRMVQSGKRKASATTPATPGNFLALTGGTSHIEPIEIHF